MATKIFSNPFKHKPLEALKILLDHFFKTYQKSPGFFQTLKKDRWHPRFFQTLKRQQNTQDSQDSLKLKKYTMGPQNSFKPHKKRQYGS